MSALVTCPHCGLQAISGWAKLSLGWSRCVPCRACGLTVRVAPLLAMVVMLPCLAVVVVASLRWLRDPVALALSGMGAIAVTTALHVWTVPLVKAQLTDVNAVRRAQGRRD